MTQQLKPHLYVLECQNPSDTKLAPFTLFPLFPDTRKRIFIPRAPPEFWGKPGSLEQAPIHLPTIQRRSFRILYPVITGASLVASW